MAYKPIVLDRRENSYNKVGGIYLYWCDYDSDVANLPKGLPDETGTASPLTGSVDLVGESKSYYVLNTQNQWIKWG